MKNRTLAGSLLTMLIVLAVAVYTVNSQEDIKQVNDPAFSERIRPPVPFRHDEHNQKAQIEDCSTCHHVYKEGKPVEGESSEGTACSECHTLKKGDNPMSLVRVYHLQCRGCHVEKKAGPLLCGECHQKQE